MGATAAASGRRGAGSRRAERPDPGRPREQLVAEEALLADEPATDVTTPDFDGYPAVLVRLDRIGLEDLNEVVVEAWLARAPKNLAREYVETSL